VRSRGKQLVEGRAAGAPFSEASLIQLAVDLQAHYSHYEEAPSFA
jgi:hypothetical protein